MLTERQQLILGLIIEEFVKTAEPIGSRTLSKVLNYSSATIRNEMADLEDMGFLEKTHTSSGRIPSEKGYRFYVETILSNGEKEFKNYSMIDELFNNKEIEREEAIKAATNLLSQLTNYTTIALGPNAYGSRVRKIELIPLKSSACLILVVTNQGHVENKQITLPDNMDMDEMIKVIDILNEVLYDCPISKVSEKLHYEIQKQKIKELLDYREMIVESFIEAFTKFTQSKYYLSGQSKMLYQPEFNDVKKLRELLTVIEQKEIFKLVENTKDGLTVKIGRENQISAMQNCTLITVPYKTRENQHGTIAVVGPTRMEYKKVIPLIRYLAENMSKLYDD